MLEQSSRTELWGQQAFHRSTATDRPAEAATELAAHTRILAVASAPCLESGWHDTSSRRGGSGAGNERGGRLGTVVCAGEEGKTLCLLTACAAILPGSQSELHPAPPSFPWKRGSNCKGYNKQPNSPRLPSFKKCLEPWSLSSAASRGGTEPYVPLNCTPVWPSLSSKWVSFF